MSNPWQWLKQRFSRDTWSHASVTAIEGFGLNGAKPRPFNYERACRQFHSWVYAAAMLNAQAVAAVPLRLYARRSRAGVSPITGKRYTPLVRTQPLSRSRCAWLRGHAPGGPSAIVREKAARFGDDIEEVVGPVPALDLLRTVNPFFNGYQLAVQRVLDQELTGNAYVHPVIDPAMGVPIELWPMPASWVSVIPDPSRFIAGYSYGRPGGQPTRFEPHEVIHFRYPNPNNLYYGLGKVEAAWSALQVMNAKREMDTALYDNMARPDYAAIVRQGATPDQLDRFETRINEQLRGSRQAGKFLAITGDVQLQPLNFPPKDLGQPEQFIEEVAAVFGVPVSKLKTNDPNRANAEAADLAWRRDTIAPLVMQDEQKLNESYLPLFHIEDDAFLAYDDPVPAQRSEQVQRWTQLVDAGVLTPNEARLEDGYEPISGGDGLRSRSAGKRE